MWDIHAVPAYGRDYKSKAAVLADWNSGKDFRSDQGYLNIHDAENIESEIWVRYDNQTKLVRVHVFKRKLPRVRKD